MKKIIALILALAMTFSVAGAYWFDDIKDSKNQEAIELLYELGIIEGYGYREFGPKDNLTRAQACALIVRALVPGQEIYKSYDENFNDVDFNSWFRIYVDTAYRCHFVNGYGNGSFGPHDKLTYAQFATILTNVLGYDANKLGEKWPENVLRIAGVLDLFYNTAMKESNDFITREDAAQMIYNAMDCEIVEITKNGLEKTNTFFKGMIITDYTYTIEGTVIYVEQAGGNRANRFIAHYWIVCGDGSVQEIYGPSMNVISEDDYVVITYSFAGDMIDTEILPQAYIDNAGENNVYHINADCELITGVAVKMPIPASWVKCPNCSN